MPCWPGSRTPAAATVIKAADPAALRVGVHRRGGRARQPAAGPVPAARRMRPRTSTWTSRSSAGGTTYDDSAFVSLDRGRPRADRPRSRPASALVGRGALLGGAAALGLGLAVILGVVLAGSRGQSESQKRIGAYLGETRSRAPARPDLKDSAVAFTETLVKGDFETRLSQRLNAAGISFTAAEWILLHAGIAVAVGPARVRARRRGAAGDRARSPARSCRRSTSSSSTAVGSAAFGAQLPETLTLMSGGLSAGLSMAQAVDTVVQEGHEPMAGELRRALVEHRLGIGIEDTLEGVAERMESEDFGWVVMAIRIQREVGGNLVRDPQHRRRHAARAGVPPPPGQDAQRGGPAVRLDPRRPAGRRCSSTCWSPTATTSARSTPSARLADARRRRGPALHRASGSCPGS